MLDLNFHSILVAKVSDLSKLSRFPRREHDFSHSESLEKGSIDPREMYYDGFKDLGSLKHELLA